MRNSIITIIMIFFIISLQYSFTEANKELAITITQITNNNASQMNPRIYGDFIVWTDGRSDSEGRVDNYHNADVYLLNVHNLKEIQITSNDSWEGSPQIYKNYIVYEDYLEHYNFGDTVLYNIDTDGFMVIEENKPSGPSDIWGTNVVFISNDDLINDDLNIYLYNLTNSEETPIYTAEGEQSFAHIWGNNIVWNDKRNGDSDVYGYNLELKKEFIIADGPTSQGLLSIWEDVLLYMDAVDATHFTYYLYNLTTRSIIQELPKGVYAQFIWGDYLVNGDAYLKQFSVYQISTNTTYISKITNMPISSITSIYENKCVYWAQPNGTGPSDIYLLEFEIVNNTNGNGSDDKGHNSLSIPSATMSFLIMSIILIAIIRRKK